MQSTSLDAFDGIKKDLGKRQADVLRAIKVLGKPTNLEIANFLGKPINSITPRTNELVKKFYVTDCGIKISPSGRPAMMWRAL